MIVMAKATMEHEQKLASNILVVGYNEDELRLRKRLSHLTYHERPDRSRGLCDGGRVGIVLLNIVHTRERNVNGTC